MCEVFLKTDPVPLSDPSCDRLLLTEQVKHFFILKHQQNPNVFQFTSMNQSVACLCSFSLSEPFSSILKVKCALAPAASESSHIFNLLRLLFRFFLFAA